MSRIYTICKISKIILEWVSGAPSIELAGHEGSAVSSSPKILEILEILQILLLYFPALLLSSLANPGNPAHSCIIPLMLIVAV